MRFCSVCKRKILGTESCHQTVTGATVCNDCKVKQ